MIPPTALLQAALLPTMLLPKMRRFVSGHRFSDAVSPSKIKPAFSRSSFLIFLCRDPETPSANSPPSAHRYKQCKERSDAASHNSGDNPPPDKTPAAAQSASQSCAYKLSLDPTARHKLRQFSS